MHIIPPSGRSRAWTPRLVNHDGRLVKIPGCSSKDAARRLGDRVTMLVAAKQNGDPPPAQLSNWIDNMKPALFERLCDLGLLDRRRREQARPIAVHLDDYEKAVASRRSNTAEHAKRQRAYVQRLCTHLKVQTFVELTEHDILTTLKDWDLSPSSRRHYLVAMKDFARWMLRDKRTQTNTLETMPLPSAGKATEHIRRPLTVEEFQKLMAYLDEQGTARYVNQTSEWLPADRKMIYWTAVCTGYRQNELRQMRKNVLFLEDDQPSIDINAADAKNRTEGSVPIPQELAIALAKYTQHMSPAAQVFKFPVQRKTIVAAIRRDMVGAGIEHTSETGELIDFHALRTTAICWWLDVYGLPAKKVQMLARLKTIALVDTYSRKLRMTGDYGWLAKAPKASITPTKQEKTASAG